MGLGFENSFTWGGLLWGFVFGVAGFYFFNRGRKEANFPLIFNGLAMMVYPYFITNAWLTFGIGAGLFFLGYRSL